MRKNARIIESRHMVTKLNVYTKSYLVRLFLGIGYCREKVLQG